MDLNFEELLANHKQPVEGSCIPEVVNRPVVRIWSISTELQTLSALKEMVFDLLPVYWKASGIIDCKILQSRQQNTFLIIESWQNLMYQEQHYDSEVWKMAEITLRSEKTIRIQELANDIFELIE